MSEAKKKSPAAPSMSLEEAIQRTRLFYEGNKRYAVSRTDAQPDAYKAIGYSSPNGAAKRALGSVLAYGLLEKVPGSGGESKIRISTIGLEIVGLKADDPERARRIKEAARKPKVFQDLLAEFSDGLPQSDTPIHSFLMRAGFGLEAIDGLIKVFRSTVSFAGLFDDKDDSFDDRKDDDEEEADNLSDIASQGGVAVRLDLPPIRLNNQVGTQVSSTPDGQKSLQIVLAPGREALLNYPEILSADDFDFIVDFLNFMRARIIVTPGGTPPHGFKLGLACWKTAEVDQPIEIIGYMGSKDGRHFVKVAGSDSGIPFDEVSYNA